MVYLSILSHSTEEYPELKKTTALFVKPSLQKALSSRAMTRGQIGMIWALSILSLE